MGIFNEIGLRYSSRSNAKKLLSIGKYLVLVPRSVLLLHVEITGVFHGENRERTLVYIGEGESLSYFRDLCFSTVHRTTESRCWIFQLKTKQRSLPDSAVLIVELNKLLSMILKGNGYSGYPWVLQKVLTDSREYLDRKDYLLKKRGIRIRKRNYRYDTTTDESAILTFYNQFYKPYIQKRFKTLAHLRHIREFLVARKHGMLLRVFDGDQWVAGMICLRSKEEIASIGTAALIEGTDHLKQGALQAAYYFLFQWAEKHRMKSVNLFRSRPHGDDGVFHHKTRWGAIAVRDPWPHTCYAIRVPARQPVPGILENQLVWDGVSFVTLKTVTGKAGW